MSNMYDFTKTYNPLAGECAHKCKYCYVEDMKRFPVNKKKYSGNPRIDPKAIEKNLGKDHFWFVGSMTDIFAHNVSGSDIEVILDHCRSYPLNTYFFQTKNPQRVSDLIYKGGFLFPDKTIICTTIETNRDYNLSKAPLPRQRASAMSEIQYPKMVTVEPICDFDIDYLLPMISRCKPFQVNIGADSKGNKLPEPEPEKIRELIKELEKFTKVHLKPNLERLLPEIKL